MVTLRCVTQCSF